MSKNGQCRVTSLTSTGLASTIGIEINDMFVNENGTSNISYNQVLSLVSGKDEIAAPQSFVKLTIRRKSKYCDKSSLPPMPVIKPSIISPKPSYQESMYERAIIRTIHELDDSYMGLPYHSIRTHVKLSMETKEKNVSSDVEKQQLEGSNMYVNKENEENQDSNHDSQWHYCIFVKCMENMVSSGIILKKVDCFSLSASCKSSIEKTTYKQDIAPSLPKTNLTRAISTNENDSLPCNVHEKVDEDSKVLNDKMTTPTRISSFQGPNSKEKKKRLFGIDDPKITDQIKSAYETLDSSESEQMEAFQASEKYRIQLNNLHKKVSTELYAAKIKLDAAMRRKQDADILVTYAANSATRAEKETSNG